jgi:uncharacterized damage-inducible protein DinB
MQVTADKEMSMLPAAQAMIAELEIEAATTRRVLSRVPEDRLGWRPHPKSMSAGQLAHHVAGIPGIVARIAGTDSFDLATRGEAYASCESAAAAVETLERSVDAARAALLSLDEAASDAVWRMQFGDRLLFAMPRLGAMRVLGLSHLYHHRGELVVYLRLLDVPVPIVYGRSADESPITSAA